MVRKKTKKTKIARKNKNKPNFLPVYMGIAALIIIFILINILSSSSTAAIVNGEQITMAEIDDYYAKIPEQYQQFISKSDILDQLISEKILLQEAAKNNIVTSDSEIDSLIDDAIFQSNMTQQEFEQRLKEQQLSLEEMKTYYKNQLTITKLLNQTILNNISSFDQDALRQATQLYLEQLKNNSKIEIKMSDYSSYELQDSLTTSSSSPITAAACLSDYGVSDRTIIFIHSNSCPHCQTMIPIVRELESEGYSFYWAESSNQEASSIANICLVDLMNGYVPQFICPLTGNEKTGAMSQEDLKTFADNCK